MPAIYENEQLRADVTQIMDALAIIGRKYEKYVYNGNIDFNAVGDATQLVSCDIEDIRCSDLAAPAAQLPVNYNLSNPTNGCVKS